VVDKKWDVWLARERYRIGEGAAACKTAVMDDIWFQKAQDLLDFIT
jgi:hypothetical protein